MGKKVSAKKDKKKLSKKAKILIIAGAVVLIILIAVAALFLWRPWESKEKTNAEDTSVASITRIEETDFEQKITTVDGDEFTPKITEGTSDNLSMRFSELSCAEDCSNVDVVKIGGKTLKRGEDYEVKQGSVILIIYAKVFSGMEAGEAIITFEVTEDNKVLTVGVKITIEKKEEEKSVEDANDKTTTSDNSASGNNSASGASASSSNAGANSGSSATSAVDAAKAACEARTDGPVGFVIYHFLNASEKVQYKQQYQSDEDLVVTTFPGSTNSGQPMKMAYVNGTCVPSMNRTNAAGDIIVGGALFAHTKEALTRAGISQMTDFVTWQYANGREVNQSMTNANAILSW